MENSIETTDYLGEKVKELFGLSYLFPYQRLVISNIMEAAEALNEPEQSDRVSRGKQIVILPTGAGKSLCFQFPAMLLPGPTLVLYPILSLMADQQRRLEERGLSPVLLRGGQSEKERQAIWQKIESGESRFIIANPEVLLVPRMLQKLKSLKIAHMVIDEAHCVSEWGESFRPAYLQIAEIVAASGCPLVTAFTATASALVLEKIEKYVFGEDSGVHRIIGSPDRANIRYASKGCVLRDIAVRDLLAQSSLPAIVFCSSRPGTEKLAAWLKTEFSQMGLDPLPQPRFYHAGLSREEKNEVEQWFFSSKEGVLVSTCAYGMGVDKADIRTVIHRDCPPSVEAYLQESGRAGRDGKQSQAVLLWGSDDEGQMRRAKGEQEKKRLQELLDYARNGTACRRAALLRLLNYEGFGDSPETACCDVCDGEAAHSLREEFTVLDFFRKNRQAYSVDEATKIFSLSKNIRWSSDQARLTIEEFISMGKIKISKNPLFKEKIRCIDSPALNGKQ